MDLAAATIVNRALAQVVSTSYGGSAIEIAVVAVVVIVAGVLVYRRRKTAKKVKKS